MAEYIEREAALNADFKIPAKRLDTRIKTARDAAQAYANYIAGLPTADVKPVVRGEWKPSAMITSGTGSVWRTHGVACSVCNSFYLEETNFCPNCGADMRGVDDG